VRPGITDAGMLWEEGHNIGGDGIKTALKLENLKVLST
jgi:hypothetical protein